MLKNDPAFAAQVSAALAKLLPYQIGAAGNLQEWYHDWADQDPKHRHQSHLYGLYPGTHVTVEGTPAIAAAAKKTLEVKGDETTGWSKGWRINLWARLKDGDHAYKMYRELLKYVEPDGVKVNYQSIGSGGGIKQIDSKTVDFGASDAPQTDDALKAKGQIQFPTVILGVVPIINVKGIEPGQLKLSGQVLGDIYLGKITRWNDPAIKAINPSVNLPDAAIAPVRRADGSGTTFLFTSYLSKVNAEWKAKVGENSAVNWPVGAGGKGNEGVSAFVARLPNSIGYVEYTYVKQNKLSYVMLQNADGQFVAPDDTAFKAAAAGAPPGSTKERRGFSSLLSVSISASIRSTCDAIMRKGSHANFSPVSGVQRSAPRSNKSFWIRPSMASTSGSLALVWRRAMPIVELVSSTVP